MAKPVLPNKGDPKLITGAVGWQRAEGLLMAFGGLIIAGLVAPGWGVWLWLVLLLAPDLAMLGYMAGPKAGAITYNLAHLYALPFLLMLMGVAGGTPQLIAVGGLWLAHVGTDRALGWGLKLPESFYVTHLGRIGRDR